ncbi:MAG: class I SAM-dependent methyltransferase [Flavobacteriales bacterium]
MLLLSPNNFKDYELIDSGNFEKLERFGPYVTIRPEPQALWDKKIPEKEWQKKAHVRFVSKSSSSGVWQKLKEMPDRWVIHYQNKHIQFKLRLALTSFKHVGVFPEQAVNWDFIADSLKKIKASDKKFLNLFAYTGAASLAAKSAGADVTHVDSVKQVVTWANENQNHSGLKDIRWVVEDAMKFVQREVKRGNRYHGIILDPPAYGHGASGESWKLEKQLNPMMNEVMKLLHPDEHFLILNTYSLGFSSLIIDNLIQLDKGQKCETGELFLPSQSGQKLPLGVFGRITKFK